MTVPIQFKDTIQIRGRADTLFRNVMDPRRRAKWDPNVARASFVEGERLGSGTLVRFKLPRRLLGFSFTAKYGAYQAPHRGGWESVRPFGPVDRLAQGWVFKSVPGGSEVTLSVNARVRYRWLAGPVERLLRSASAQTLIELQRQVDAGGAQTLLDTAREVAKQQKAAKKGKKAR